MAETNIDHNATTNTARFDGNEKNYTNGTNANGLGRQMTHEEHTTARAAARFGYGPLAHIGNDESRLPAFGGEFQPGTYAAVKDRKFANPAPLGLCAFALTTFVLGLINMGTRGLTSPSLVIGPAFAYGGLCQLLAGMWEMAVGNTFGATALSSYGGFWIGTAIILTPGGFEVEASVVKAGGASAFADEFGFYLIGWFIFTFLLLLCTLRSTVAFFSLFFSLDMAFLLLGTGYLHRAKGSGAPQTTVIKAGGFFALLAAFLAWYNALAGLADDSNSFFILPVIHFPWSETGRARRNKGDKATV